MFFFKQKTAFELHISDWSSDVCSSDRAGAFGIRIENLVVVTPQRIAGAEEDMLGFETITFAPIAQNLVEVALLSGAEADWLDAYHAEVLAKLGADMGGEERAWLEAACAPLDRTVAALAEIGRAHV